MKNRVLLVGDAMIDTYVYGDVSRISPEAPVPVLKPQRIVQCLGGAGNVARNAAALGAEVTVIFVIGKDNDGAIIKKELKKWDINCEYLLNTNSLHTINKTRIVGNDQQIVRVDYHDQYILDRELEANLLEHIRKAISENDIIVISDYGKGTCTEAICKEIIAMSKGRPVIVDPKGSDWDKYKGAAVITPNMKEINTYSGFNVHNDSESIKVKYSDFHKKIGVQYLLLTRSECGISLIGKNLLSHIPAETQEVYDVSGAGDTVVAALAATLHPDLQNIEEAVYISNVAAGIVVSKPGTAVVTREEIQARISIEVQANVTKKIFTLDDYEQLEKQIKLWKTAGEKIVTTNGCFDIVHLGHIKLLQKAKTLGSKLLVVINSDASVKRLKGEDRPINSELDRAYVLSAIKEVDGVVIFDPQKTPYELNILEQKQLGEIAVKAASEAPMFILNLIKPDVHVKGGDYKADTVPEAIYSKELVFVSLVQGYSTTKIINKCND